jgi:transposase
MKSLQIFSRDKILSQIQSCFQQNTDGKFMHKVHSILLKLENPEYSCESLAQLLGHCPKTIANWIHKLNQSGDINSLHSLPITGRKPRLNAEQLAAIKEVLQKSPEQSGISANIWDGKSLSFYIEQTYQIVLGVRQCQRLFSHLGFSLKRARPVVAKGDLAAKEVFKKTSGKVNQ